MTWPAEKVREALELHALGLNPTKIGRLIDVPRMTVSMWVRGETPRYDRASGGREHSCRRCGAWFPFSELADYSYAHLLGLYLGDGLVSRAPRKKELYTLRVFLDARYPIIVRECQAAMGLPRYQFCNHSLDIQRLFCETCDAVGVEWRQMNKWNISVARRDSVALMDRHIGPKR